MSFWSKFTQNKVAVLAAAGAILGGAVFWAYKQYEKESEDKVESQGSKNVAQVPPAKEFDLRAEINKLKAEINAGDPTFEDIKKIFRLITDFAKSKTLVLAAKYKADRRKRFPKEIRYTRMPEYMRETANGLMELQNVLLQLQNEQGQIMAAFGLSQQSMAKYAAQLGPFMQELQMQELNLNGDINLENTRLYLHLKTEYLEQHGDKLAEALLELASSLPLQEKQLVPIFLTTFIIDEVFEHQPTLDREQFQIAAEHYKNALTPQLIAFEKAIMPLMGRLQTALAGDQMGGYGGYGGYGAYPEEYDNAMGPGFSPEAMQQQMEALRQQDPQAYEQLMAMMQAQMGR